MQTHDDKSHKMAEWFKTIEEKAAGMVRNRESEITAGKPGEEAIREQEVDGMLIRRLPDDPLCLRISIGGSPLVPNSFYFVFRGDATEIEGLLDRAREAFKSWGR